MKRQTDKHRTERSFHIGDWVFLKLQPYVQSSVAARSNNKLSFKFFGPFRIVKRVGKVAYHLDLPASASVHPVFHVSLLKRSPGSQAVSPSIPSELTEFQVPEKLLQWRWSSGERPVHQVLVKWSHMPAALATWESVDELRRQFPRSPAWGHAGTQGGGIVSNTPDTTTADAAGDPEGCPSDDVPPSPRPKRQARPNSKVFGPMWQA
jgi:hypothetical protein